MKARLVKEHVHGMRFRAALEAEGEIVFRPYRQNWTRASRHECYAWAAENGYVVKLLPQDAREGVST